MVNVYLSGADARNAAADLWQQDQLKQLNDQFAPPPAPEPAQPLPPAPVEAAGVQGSSLPSPAAAGPSLTQPAPPAAVPPPQPSAAPNPTPDRNQIADQWQRSAIADAWEQNAISDVTKGVSQAGQGVQSALADVPQEARGLVSNYAALPGATAPQSAQAAPATSPGIQRPPVSAGQVATVSGPQNANVQVDASSPEAFIRSIAPAAQAAAARLGVPAEALIGMAANETGYGKFAAGNNLFGIKGSGPAGSTNAGTWEDYGNGPVQIRDNFRAYNNAQESFNDFADLIAGASRYKAALGQPTVEGFVQALKNGGYMTDPNYVGKISNIVKNFSSTIQDAMAGGGGQQAASAGANAGYVFPVQGYSGDVALHWGDVKGGSDLFAPRGTPVVAMRGGKVVEAGYNSVGGNSVLIQGDDGNQYYYAHFNDAPSVKVGQVVQAGTYLGPVGNTGDAAHTDTHLHIGIGPSILLGADKFGGTGGNFDAVGLLRNVLSGQGQQQATGPANGPQAINPPAGLAQVGQNAQQAVQQTAQGIIGAVGNIGGALGTTASNIGSTLNSPDLPSQIYQHSPIGAVNAGLQGVGQGVISPALNAITQPGGPLIGPRTAAAGVLENAASNVPSGVPVVGGVLQHAAGLVGGPTVIDQIGMVQDLANKYPSNVPGLPDVTRMTPQDQAQWSNLMIGVGGITGGEGAGGESLAPKAGNINLAKYPAEVQDVIQAAAPTIPESATRGVVPDAVVRDLAAMSGTSVPDIVANWKPGQAQNAETLYALRDALVTQGRQVLDAQQALRANPDSVDAQAMLVQALTQHRDLQTVVSGSTAEWGRAGRVFQQPVEGNIVALQQLQNLAQRTGQSVDQLARDLAGMDLNDPAQMAQVARVLNPPRLPPNEYLPTGPQPGQYGMFGQELPLGGPRPQGSEMLGPAGPQPGQLQFGSELPVGGPRPTGTEPLAVGPQPGQFQLESELPLGGPRPTGTEPPLPAGRMPGQQGLGIGEQYQQDLLAPRAGPFEAPNVPTPAQTPEQADFLRRGMTLKALQTNGPLPDIPYQGPAAQNLQGVPSGRPSPPTATMRLPGFPNPDSATPLEIFRAYHTGNVVSSPATAVHVALNSVISPAWSLGARGAADLLGGTLNAATGAPTGNLGRAIGRGAAVGSAMAEFGRNLAQGFSEFYANPANVANKIDNPLASGLLKAQQAVGAALHSSFQNASQAATTRLELAAQAGERAWNEGARGQDLMNRIGDLMTNPTPDMLARAQDVGTRAALRGSAGATQQVMQKIAEIPFIGNTLFPVVRIGAQSIAQGVEKSPLGLVGTGFDVARAAAGKGPYAGVGGFSQVGGAVTPLADRLTNNLAGTALTTFLTFKALDGTITGNGPDDPKARATLQSQGWQPNSVYVPGRGYMDYHALGPLAIPFSIAGNIGDSILYSKPQPGESGGDQVKAATLDLTRRVADYLASGTGMRTIGDMWDLIHGGGNAAAVGAQFAGSVAGGFVPLSAALRAGVAATDPFQRRPESGNVQQVVQQGLPGGTPLIGGRQDLPIRQDVLGRPEANPQQGIGAVLPRTGTGQPDPMLMLLSRAGIELPATAPKTISYSGRQIQLTPDEQQQRQTLFGQRLQQTLQGYLKSDKFQALPPDQQYKALEPVVRAASTYADQRLVAEMPAADRKARMASAPRAYGAGVVPYLAAGSGSGGLASLIARQSGAEADAAHQRLIAQYSSQPTQPQLAAAS